MRYASRVICLNLTLPKKPTLVSLCNLKMLHKNIESLSGVVDLNILPKEYGGEVPISDMIVEFKRFLESKRHVVMELDKMSIMVNKKTKFISEFDEQQITGMAGSFRKLQVD